MSISAALDSLVALSRAIGDPALDAVVLGEGNTSVKIDDATFLVKGSGCNLATFAPEHAVHLRFDRILALLDGDGPVAESALSAAYEAAKVDPAQKRRPSVEAIFHAYLLSLPGVGAVAHSHATAVNGLTCGRLWPHSLTGRMCPDEAVVLGPDSVFVPYVDPGVVLGRAIRDGVAAYRARHGAVPKVIYMQNHGVIAVGASPTECVNVTIMAIKAARMRLMALQAGGIALLDDSTVAHLLGRPDEKYRQQQLAGR